MRVIAGKYRSRRLKTLDDESTRPTLGHIKESFFNRVGPYFYGESVLDVFGGSGAIAIEFLSRGAGSAVIIEKNPAAVSIIKENTSFVEEEVQIIKASYVTALEELNKKFDYIYCDPPYYFKKVNQLFEMLKPLCHENTIIFFESDKKEDIQTPDGFKCLRYDKYKRTTIAWYQLDQSH